jgi:hypothetical protein
MRLTTLFLVLLAVAPMYADGINFTDWHGTATVADTGIFGNASLICYSGIKAYNGHSLGSVSFQTGALASGTVFGGGTYSSVGSMFTITGNGQQRIHQGVIFSGTFTGPIQWTLISHSGGTSNFGLSGKIYGMLWSGRTTTGYTTQLISISGNRAFVVSGNNSFGDGKLTTPEPETLSLLGTGIVVIAGVFRKRLLL